MYGLSSTHKLYQIPSDLSSADFLRNIGIFHVSTKILVRLMYQVKEKPPFRGAFFCSHALADRAEKIPFKEFFAPVRARKTPRLWRGVLSAVACRAVCFWRAPALGGASPRPRGGGLRVLSRSSSSAPAPSSSLGAVLPPAWCAPRSSRGGLFKWGESPPSPPDV